MRTKRLRCLSVTLAVWCSAFLLQVKPVAADALPITTLPSEPVTRSVRNLQRKADKAFERGQYERAYRVFMNKLAPKGDKHAHYMIGHMHHHGLGVDKDPVRAVAWYAIASERGAEGARNMGLQLLETLDESEQARADALVVELMNRYGDRPLLVRAIRRDMRELKMRTGSYLGAGSSQLRILSPDSTGTTTQSGDDYYDILKARIALRTQMLGGNVTLGEFELIDTPEEESVEAEEP